MTDPISLDLTDPDIIRMVQHNHRPEELWSNVGTLLDVHCEMCTQEWPCDTITAVRREVTCG